MFEVVYAPTGAVFTVYGTNGEYFLIYGAVEKDDSRCWRYVEMEKCYPVGEQPPRWGL